MELIFDGKNILDCSKEELIQAGDLLKRAWSLTQQKAVVQFRAGDHVEWDSKRGEVISGTVIKINQKSVSVKTEFGKWNVSGSLLRKHLATAARQ